MNETKSIIRIQRFKLNSKKLTTISAIVICCVACFACNTLRDLKLAYKKMELSEKAIVDTIFKNALDYEALYTLLDTLKPISSIKFYRFSVLSENKQQADSASNALLQLQTTINKLSTKHFSFILNPFQRPDSIYKNFELYVVRNSKMQTIIAQHTAFYNSIGISPFTKPETVLAVTEYESKYNRWRSYGYLFGYPNYAVDFFVHAGKQQDSTKQFVKRDFFAIPVFAGNTGHFTYAIPKGVQPTIQDSIIYKKAFSTLQYYKKVREKFLQANQLHSTILVIKNKRE